VGLADELIFQLDIGFIARLLAAPREIGPFADSPVEGGLVESDALADASKCPVARRRARNSASCVEFISASRT
jgi:hypothetical protein